LGGEWIHHQQRVESNDLDRYDLSDDIEVWLEFRHVALVRELDEWPFIKLGDGLSI